MPFEAPQLPRKPRKEFTDHSPEMVSNREKEIADLKEHIKELKQKGTFDKMLHHSAINDELNSAYRRLRELEEGPSH